MQLKEGTVNNTETAMVAGDVVAVLNVTDNATSVSGHVEDNGNGLFVHTMEIRFDKVKSYPELFCDFWRHPDPFCISIFSSQWNRTTAPLSN